MSARQRKPNPPDGESIEAQRNYPQQKNHYQSSMSNKQQPPPHHLQPPPPQGKKPLPQMKREPEIDEEEPKNNKGKGRECCKKFLKFLFSHIGLCGMVVAYSVAGGFIFEHLEKYNEKQECVMAEEKYRPMENETLHKLWKISKSFETDEYMEDEIAEFQRVLRKFRASSLDLGYNGDNCTNMGNEGGPGYKWSFAGSLLFSVTVITTIGYGNIAPKTFWGRLVCIAYATLGIPLMLLCLANIGDVMADIFRFIYSKVCCCGCCRKKDRNRVQSLQPGTNNTGQKTPDAWKEEYNNHKAGGPLVVDDDEDEEDDEDEKISVPLTVTMAVIGGYIFMGAVLFGVWEKWDSLKASYFCFVTISTIGFGDVVPGSANFENSEDQYKMILSAIYMVFGMAILSMCFSLIQEEIVAKFKWVGTKLGILEKEKPEGEAEEEEDPMNSNNSPPTQKIGQAPPPPQAIKPPPQPQQPPINPNPSMK